MLTKPNMVRLVIFILAFAAALYYPIRQIVNFEKAEAVQVEK